MIEYINAVKRGIRDQCGVVPTGGTTDEPLFDNVPDGVYPMVIDGKLDHVRIEAGKIFCCNFLSGNSPSRGKAPERERGDV